MKTAEQKAYIAVKKWSEESSAVEFGSPSFHALCDCLEMALKEQDRDTRHTCAEAVIHASDPHAACMNVKAV